MAISYDDVETIAAFADRYGITFPLLSDPDTAVIRALGLVDPRPDAETSDEPIGYPYPGTFELDEAGIIVDRRFEENFRVRPTATLLLEQLGEAPAAATLSAPVNGSGVVLRAWTAESGGWSFQRLQVHLDIGVEPGLHIYGSPTPDGYRPLSVVVDGDQPVEVGTILLPDARPFEMVGLDETFVVHEGTLDIVIPIGLPRFVPPDELVVRIQVGYQACAATYCHAPEERLVTLRIPAVAVV